MSLQGDIDEQVALIHARLNSASAAAGQILPTPVDLSEVIDAIPDGQSIDSSPLAAALTAVADQVDALGGDGAAIREAIAAMGNRTVDFSPVKAALTEAGSLIGSVSENLDRAASATGDHLEGSSGVVSLLIDQSNYDGANQ